MTLKTAFNVATAIVVMVIVPTVALGQSPETIPQALARGATGRVTTPGSGNPPSIESVLRETDLIVRGTVGEPRSYLSDDERDVYTEYTMTKPAILYATISLSSRGPGPVQQIAVSQLGGTLVVNGQTFTQTEQGLPLLRAGSEMLLLLQRVGNRWHIVKTFYGAFAIENGSLRPLGRPRFAAEFRGVETTAGITQLLARSKAVKKQ